MSFNSRWFRNVHLQVLLISFLVGGAGALWVGVQQTLRMAEDSVLSNLKVAVFFPPYLTDLEARQWAAALPAHDPAIQSVVYVSREEAFKRAQANPLLTKSLILLRRNPFPSSIVIRYDGQAWNDRPEPASTLRNQPQVQEIRWDPELRSAFRSLAQWRAWLLRVGVFGMGIMVLGSLYGIFRFGKGHHPWSDLWTQAGVGLVGGGLAIGGWGIALRALGSDAARYRPTHVSLWPLVAALLASLAASDRQEPHRG